MNIKDIYIRDPFVYVEDGIAYLVGTTDKTCWGGKASSFLGYKSSDLVNFEGPYILFENDGNFWSDENYWAPELYKVDGKYLLVASFFKQGKMRRSQILTCESPLGRYKPVNKPFTPENWMCLDATLLRENGKLYTAFCHEWLQIHDGEIVYAELSDDLCSLKDEPKKMFSASEAPWTRKINQVEPFDYVTDGPFFYHLSNGDLAMLWSSIGEKGYACGIAISHNGIQGPWEHCQEPLFKENGGHGMIFNFKGQTYLSLHCPNEPRLAERPHFYKLEEKDGKLIYIDF